MSEANQQKFDVIVAGVGSMGAAACYHLAKRGHSVLGIEQFDIPHARGSHHGHSRMIRQSYFEHPDYVPLLKRAYELWDDLQNESGGDLIKLTGGLYLGTPDSEILRGATQAAKAHALPHEKLDHSELLARFPQFRLPENFAGFHEDRAGLLIPENVMSAHVELALKHGADLKARESIIDWKSEGSGVTVRTTKGTYHADRLVIAGGAWSGRLLRDWGIELTVTRQLLTWFWPSDPDAFRLGNFPCWFIENDSPFGHYGFPMLSGQPGFKVALHRPGETIDPDLLNSPDLAPRDTEIESLRAMLAEFIPGAVGSLLSACTCLYTNSPDSHFIIDRHPDAERVILACGFSGHGFKFASVVGEILADLAAEGKTRHPIDFLRLSRFD